MTELVKGLPESDRTTIAQATDLLTHYSFDLGHQTVSQLTHQWLKDSPAGWVRWAVIEALYQGRYKAISVDQILRLWKRRNNPCYHFNYEFERLVCNKFPKNLNAKPSELRRVNPATFSAETQPIAPAAMPASLAEGLEVTPAWVALAEQIQSSPTEESSVISQQVAEAPIEPFSAGVTSSLVKIEALIDRSSFDPNADERIEGQAIASAANTELNEPSEEHQPPIHQFTPTNSESDFYAKLKAVAEQNGENG